MSEKLQQYDTLSAGFHGVCQHLKKRDSEVIETFDANHGRYKVAKTQNHNYLVAYKRERFHNYGKEFNDTGEGENLNYDDLKKNVGRHEIKKIIFVYRSGAMYIISVSDFFLHAKDRLNAFDGDKHQKSIKFSYLKRLNG